MIRALISIAVALLVAACAGSPDGRSAAAQQRLEGYRTAYLAANLAIAGYALLKPCGDGVQAPCADLNVLAQFRTGSTLVAVALDVAQREIDTPKVGTNLERVNAVLLALTQMLVEYRLR